VSCHIVSCILFAVSPQCAGGGILADECPVVIDDSLFESNAAMIAGAIYTGQGSLTLRNTDFRYNLAAPNSDYGSGGAVYLQGTDTSLRSCFFAGNAAAIGGYDGGVWCNM
jgi:hypothetical protein